jgi:hypothetical protein
MPRMRLLAAALLCTLAGACRTADPDPTVLVRTSNGVELGVSTTHGVVFLGSTAVSGEAEIVSWFGDGPSLEPSLIEPLGDGLYTLPVDIDLPAVAIGFDLPEPGSTLVVRGRDDTGPWEREVVRAGDLPVLGLLLEPPAEPLPARSVGAGVYTRDRLGHLRLVGLLSGRARVETDGTSREVLCALGPLDLWRVVTHPRNRQRAEPWVHRDDLR